MARSILVAICLSLPAASGCLAPPTERSTVQPALFPAPDRQFRAPVATWRQVRSQNVVLQQQEYTCGAASLATVLKYFWQDDISEEKILEAALHNLDQKELEDREKNGLSMEDLSRGSSRLGYAAAVLEMEYDKLKKLPAPVVVRLLKDDFKHFVVFRGELDGRVFLADPIRGNVRIPVGEFHRQWDKKVLAVVKRGRTPPKTHPLQIPSDLLVTPERLAARRSLFEPPPVPLYRK